MSKLGKLRLFAVLPALIVAGGILSVSVSAGQKPPDGSVVFQAPPAPAPGTKFSYVFESGRRAGSWLTCTVTGDQRPFRGRDVYYKRCDGWGWEFRLSSWDRKTHNLVAVLGSGDLLRYYEPHEFEVDYPLWIGKRSANRIRQIIVEPGRSGRRVGRYKRRMRSEVIGFETVDTPIGKFETMVVMARFGRRGKPVYLWMARGIPVPIKHRSPHGRLRVLVNIEKPGG